MLRPQKSPVSADLLGLGLLLDVDALLGVPRYFDGLDHRDSLTATPFGSIGYWLVRDHRLPRRVSEDSALAEGVESSRSRILGCRGKGLLQQVHARLYNQGGQVKCDDEGVRRSPQL